MSNGHTRSQISKPRANLSPCMGTPVVSDNYSQRCRSNEKPHTHCFCERVMIRLFRGAYEERGL